MKFFRLDLLTLLISLFILNSCKNEGTIGLGVNSTNQLTGTLIDTSTIIINTVPEDSVVTSALAKTPLSYFKDPLFGTTEANIAIDVNLPTASSYTLPTGTITVDSAVLVMRFVPGFYGDSIASRYKANVYQLNEKLFAASPYRNTKRWSYNAANLLGSKSFISRVSDSIKIVNPVTGGPDTLVKVPPQLRIPISNTFINNIFINATQNQLSSNLLFKNNARGFYITLDKNQPGPGGTFMMALDSATEVQIYYRSNDGTVIDTSIITLPTQLHAAEIKHTYSTAIQTELAKGPNSGSNVVYFQGLGGLRAKVSFPYLKNIIKNLGTDIAINRAELVITAAPGSSIPFAPTPKLTMYKLDLAGQRTIIQDTGGDPRSFGDTQFGGFYYSPTQQYHFLLTAFIQDLARGVTTDMGTYIGVVANDGNTSIATTPQVDGRTYAVGFDKTSAYRIKLNIFYTKIAR